MISYNSSLIYLLKQHFIILAFFFLKEESYYQKIQDFDDILMIFYSSFSEKFQKIDDKIGLLYIYPKIAVGLCGNDLRCPNYSSIVKKLARKNV